MSNITVLFLSKRIIISIFIYYFILFIIGNFLSILVLVPNQIIDNTNHLINALTGSIGMSLIGSTIFYIRKLYKSCINGNLTSEISEDNFLIRLGTMVYYTARPLFSVGFSVLIIIGLLSGILTISTSTEKNEINVGFVYLTMFLSFFSGFSSGRFVKILEKKGDAVFEKLNFNEKNHE
jgi:hypothetical protein